MTLQEIAAILIRCPLFGSHSVQSISTLLELVEPRFKEFVAGETIASSDDECRYLYIVLVGKVKGEMTDHTGKVIRIEELISGMPLAPAFLFGQNNRYPVDIVAIENTVLLQLTKENLLLLFQNDVVVLNNFLGLLSNRAQFLTARIRFLTFQSIKGKIAQYLIKQSDRSGLSSFELRSSHTELSELFGVTRPALTRALREMNNEGLIAADGKKITILNRSGLKKLIV